MSEMFKYIATAFVLGLMAGISPGPILTLVIAETLKNDKKEGIKIAFVPLITDLPIVILSLFLLSGLRSYGNLLGIISILGALFILYLAYENIVFSGSKNPALNGLKPVHKGILANFLSPHPYLFWILVGAPAVIQAYHTVPAASFLYVVVFYCMLIGSKVLVAILVHYSRNFINQKLFINFIKALGLLLVILAMYMIYEGIDMLNIF